MRQVYAGDVIFVVFPITDNSVSYRRLEALTRSQTQIEMKSHRSQPTQILPDSQREFELLSGLNKPKDRYTRLIILFAIFCY